MESDGYVTEIEYTSGYYRELSPRLIAFSLLLNGIEPPPLEGANYLELAFGQGISANIHAAAGPIHVYGTDFLPAHAANAQALTEMSGSNAKFFADNFEEFARRDSLPLFDYIVMHGVWSWVSNTNRATILDIVKARLKPGGVFFVSYNALPGKGAERALRELLLLNSIVGPRARPILERVDAALSGAQRMRNAGARFFEAYPSAKRKLESLRKASPQYVAHEYFNQEWAPFFFSEVNAAMVDAGLEFAASQSALDAIPSLRLTPDQIRVLDRIANPATRQSLRDFLLNTAFRCDLFTRDARRLPPEDVEARLKNVRITRTSLIQRQDGLMGGAKVKKESLKPIIDFLGTDNGSPKTIGSVLATVRPATDLAMDTLGAIAYLVGNAFATPAQSDSEIERSAPTCAAINEALMARSFDPGAVAVLASPVTGDGQPVNRLEQSFLRLRAKGITGPQEWVERVWSELEDRDVRIMKDDRRLESTEANLAMLQAHVNNFAGDRLALLKALRIAE